MGLIGLAVILSLGLFGVSAATEAPPVDRVPRVGFLTWEACPSQDSVFGAALRGLGYR
jgi:hypothetical protein